MRTRSIFTISVVLVLVLLTGTLLDVMRANAQPAAQSTLGTLSLGPADMVPSDEALDYYSDGMTISIEDVAGGGFLIPVHIPAGSYIKSIQLYAFDENGASDICAHLYRNQFAQFTDAFMGTVCTSGSSGNQNVQTWAIGPQFISEHHAPYLWVDIPSMTLMAFVGVKIKYQPPSL